MFWFLICEVLSAQHKIISGQSITDPCLGWEKTERLILDLAEEL